MSNLRELAAPICIGLLMAMAYFLGFHMKEWIAEYKCKQETGAYACSMQEDRSAFTPKRGVQI